MPQTPQYQLGYADGRALAMKEVQRLRQVVHGAQLATGDLRAQLDTLQKTYDELQATHTAYMEAHP